MPLILAPVMEADLSDITAIESASFGSTSPINPLLFPNGHTDAVLGIGLHAHQKQFATAGTVYWKVVDTELNNKAIAFGRWRIRREDQPGHGQAEEEDDVGQMGADINVRILQAFEDNSRQVKKRIIAGKKRVHLSRLATLPAHQRRGAATMLLKKGEQIAEQERLDSWVVASDVGSPLYEKGGFVPVEGGTITFDLGSVGGKGMLVKKIMKRRLKREVTD
ncbi:MAG: hypothetical protein LQ340_002989 [Diploschistes diacapsis]|nr:MAG: hypothetical protein LQ340_002989 [Diploschistes diacapsis]